MKTLMRTLCIVIAIVAGNLVAWEVVDPSWAGVAIIWLAVALAWE